MKTTETVNNKVKITKEVTCDICGQSCGKYLGVVDNESAPDFGQDIYSFEFMELSSHWGYDSNKDCEKWTAQVCEKCVDTHLVSLIKFKKEDYI